MQGRQARIPNAMVEPGSSQLKMDLVNVLWPLAQKHALETGTQAYMSNLVRLITEVASRRVANRARNRASKDDWPSVSVTPIEQGAKKTG